MSILSLYHQAIEEGDIEKNPEQLIVVEQLQAIADKLEKNKTSWIARIRGHQLRGLYLYGSVGVGKTYLMDLFYQSLNYRFKARYHFHHFMQQVDAQLRRLQGEKNPLQIIARNLAKQTKLLCFDEFMVHDVAHAMILADLLKALMAQGVVFIITSNIRPDDLYLNGVQRARFLPAIALIKEHCTVFQLQLQRDYRLGREPLLEAYLYPLNAKVQTRLKEQFEMLAPQASQQGFISVQNRDIPYLQCSERAVWFDFTSICNLPRSQLDYLEIADRFDTVFISDIPVLTEKNTIYAILLIHLVDVFYDRGVRLVVSAAAAVDQLYLKGEMLKEFQRTLSRLKEMQSVDYLQRHPRRKVQEF